MLKNQTNKKTWYWLYFVLAAFDLVTIGISLFLNHQIMGLYQGSIDTNQQWSHRIEEYTQLQILGGKVNAPGNDVFDSRDVVSEQNKANSSLTTFKQEREKALIDASSISTPEYRQRIILELEKIDTKMTEMKDEADLIFGYFRNGEEAKAGERMATMDRKYAFLNEAFFQLQKTAFEIQNQEFSKQITLALQYRSYEYLIVGIIIFIVCGVTFYGRMLNKEMHKHAAEREDILNKLEQKNRELDLALNKAETINEQLTKTQNQLLQSQKMESIGKLAGGIAHDFNNLLGPILGYADMLGTEFQDNPKAQKRLSIITQSAKRAATLTKQLLGFAREGKYEKRVVNINNLIEESILMLSSSIGKDITINKILSPTLWNVEGDSTQLIQSIMNLSLNARDAMPKGGTISFETSNFTVDKKFCEYKKHLKPGPHVKLSIADTGTGIPKDVIHRIFDPFFTTKDVGKGSGLGLSMVMGIVQNHGGDIFVYSEEGRGTMFTLYLPSSNADLSVDVETEKTSPEKLHSLKGKTVMVVDDEENMRNMAGDILELLGMHVIKAENGIKALEIINQPTQVDFLILDIMMPEMGGIELYKTLKSLGHKQPVIFASGYTANAEISELLKNPATSFIQKPFKMDSFIEQLATAVMG
ncbi:response regulator [bacterium]|nr:response regulator [bacterium]